MWRLDRALCWARAISRAGSVTRRRSGELRVCPPNRKCPRERIARTIARQTGKPLEVVLADIERDRWMSAEEAVDYGLVSRVIEHKTTLKG